MFLDKEVKEAPAWCYRQRDGESLVLRAHVPMGKMNEKQLHALRIVLDEHPEIVMRLTTRQNARLYNIKESGVEAARNVLKEAGFVDKSRSTGLVLNADHGLLVNEVFDVFPYAQEILRWLDDNDGPAGNLPGKMKVSITSSSDRPRNVSYSDIAFVARVIGGTRVFDVLGGGSLGAQPRVAKMLYQGLAADRILEALDAMAKVFSDLFANSNIGKKRMRFKIRQIGEEKFIDMFNDALNSVRSHRIDIKEASDTVERPWASKLDHNFDPRIRATKSSGIYSVSLPSRNGFIDRPFLAALDDWVQRLGHPVEMALDSDQSILLRDLGGVEAANLLAYLQEKNVAPRSSALVCCSGANYCRFGLTHPETLCEVINHFDAERLPRIQVSGCMNSCSAQQLSGIGFWGKRPDKENPMNELFDVTIGGMFIKDDQEAVLAERAGNLTVAQIADFLSLLIDAKEKSSLDWTTFLTTKKDDVIALVAEFEAKNS